jgi:hypothetical protein
VGITRLILIDKPLILFMAENLLKSIIWTDYRLAVLFTIFIPFVLLIWSFLEKIPSIQRLLIIYWRVASLFICSIYLLIPVWQIGYLTSFVYRILIPISLWFWVDLNDEIKDLPKKKLKLCITSWRWAMTFYSFIGAIATIPLVSCSFSSNPTAESLCLTWLEVPWQYKTVFHSGSTTGFLGFLGMTGLIIYIIYFAYFLLFRLIKQGRIALEQ